MQILGQEVRHNLFGEGIIKDISGKYITIGFAKEDKRFLYPDAFSRFLKLKDLEKQKELDEKNTQLQELKKIEKAEKRRQQERYHKIRTMKITSNSQAAFHVDFYNAESIIEQGSVSTGCYLSGTSKGKPRVPKKLKPNSVCLITGLRKGDAEKNRCILGAFIVKEDFLGEYCTDGIIRGHQKYKICLNPDTNLFFWNYFEHDGTFPCWGNVPFKYFSNTIMQKILSDIVNIKKGTKQEMMVSEFYQYFCKINGLSIKQKNVGGV